MNDRARAGVIIMSCLFELLNIFFNVVVRDKPTDASVNLIFTSVIAATFADRALSVKAGKRAEKQDE